MSTMVERVAQALQQEMGTAPSDETGSISERSEESLFRSGQRRYRSDAGANGGND